MQIEDVKTLLKEKFPNLGYEEFEHKTKSYVFCSYIGDYILELRLEFNKTKPNKLWYRAYKNSYGDCFFINDSTTPEESLINLSLKSIYQAIEKDVLKNQKVLNKLSSLINN